MSINQLLVLQPLPFCEREAAEAIIEEGEHNLYFSVSLAIAYGIIFGKRQERAKRKGKTT